MQDVEFQLLMGITRILGIHILSVEESLSVERVITRIGQFLYFRTAGSENIIIFGLTQTILMVISH